MKKIYILAVGAMLPILMGSCSDSFNANDAAGDGRLILRPSVSTDLKASRAIAGDELQKLSDECIIWISSSKGLVRKYDGISNVPQEGIWLAGGRYTAEAWAGDSVPASFDARYFKGVEQFDITAGGTTQVNLACGIANTAVSVKYAEAIDDVLSDYTLTVGHSCGKLTWDGRDDRRGYFMMNSRDKDLVYTLEGTRQDGSAYKYEGKIEAVKPATEYILNVRYNGTDVEYGGVYFTIEVDESTIDMEETIEIVAAPSIVGVYQNIETPVYGEAGKMSRQAIYVAAAAPLKSVYVSAPSMADVIGINNGEFDMIRADEMVLDALSERGVKGLRVTDTENGLDNLKISFEPELLNQLGDGTYEINVTATLVLTVDDGNGGTRDLEKTNSAKMTIIISDADVQAEPLPSNDPSIWATEATLTAKVMKEGVESVGFNYREKGTADWTSVEGVVSRAAIEKGSSYSVVLRDLKPGTTYEYVATAGDFVANNVYEFTTEAAAQLPNAGFEDWVQDGKTWLIASDNNVDTRFWDSGNHGSSKMNKNVTGRDSEIKHSGEYSIKMESQFVGAGVIGAFAAGNVFVGQFLGTENTTKGILGWGRPWNSRPRALKGYVKYTPQAVTYSSCDYKKVGDMDAGIVYIAIVDNSTMTYGSYSGWPQIVATKNIEQYGFKKEQANVIAYGEKIFTEATADEGLIEFEIPLDYYRPDVKAANIIIVASASQYGDYYTGGPSVMYLDDLELVY